MRRMARLPGINRIATAVMLLLIPAAVHATPVTYHFSGTTIGLDGPDGGNASIPGGTPFSGSFTYDSKLPLIDMSTLVPGYSDPTTSNYGYFDPTHPGPLAAINANVNFGGLISYATSDSTTRVIVVQDEKIGSLVTNPSASFSVNAQEPTGDWLEVYLRDSTGQALNGTALPTTLDLSKFGDANVEYYTESGLVGGNITSLEAETVPEPSTLAILAVGGLGLAIARRRARNRRPIG